MIEVTAQRTIKFRTETHKVKVYGFTRLTPRAARAALEIAFGRSDDGTVWSKEYGYRVYGKSARKIYNEV